MIPVSVINRPFSTEFITGLMLPDGIFEATLGRQQLNAYFSNLASTPQSGLTIYVESTSNPGVVVENRAHNVTHLAGGASTLKSWSVDVSNAPPGKHYVSFIVDTATETHRIVKQIFVTRVSFDASTKTFTAETPECTIQLLVNELLTNADGENNCKCQINTNDHDLGRDAFLSAMALAKQLDINDFKDCSPPTLLIKKMSIGVVYTPPFAGQYGDLPFQDPWIKTLLVVIAVALFIAALVVTAVVGTVATAGIAVVATAACCSVPIIIAIGLTIGAISSAILASALDVRDPFRRGQDATPPLSGEVTTKESLEFNIDYLDPIEQGRPYSIGAKWKYTRHVRDQANSERTYEFSASEVNKNIHVLSKYTVDAPDVVRLFEQRRRLFVVRAQFFDVNEKSLSGAQLFVKCYLQRKADNKIISFVLADDGSAPDSAANDGVYSGTHWFREDDGGIWHLLVIAQDVNFATENMTPDEAAKIIGGQVLTNQLSVDYSGGTCAFVSDGFVNVI